MLTTTSSHTLVKSFKFPTAFSVEKNTVGISEDQKIALAARLNGILADSYLLMLKTHAYHWNVKSRNGKAFQQITEVLYSSLFDNVDNIADRISELGFDVLGTFKEFRETSIISEAQKGLDVKEMARDLLMSHNEILLVINENLEFAHDIKDEVSIDILIEKKSFHEQSAWTLEEFINNH